ncbi:TIGR04084 family radical SAM/SPASM domain-containing protein [Methanocella conradii]|uniref:TIGR04084 family radical SAM/SPASM domain-containing protein n=1 Tax=Methanocella conradii TaxID=1175444 RepID=UPI001ED9071C|nr:TIGR04084 family radical SAM/SPASM domain-containing protein [Methanocella conradii]
MEALCLNFFITLTTACDLQCRYCYGECCDDFDESCDEDDIDYYLPRDLSYDAGALKAFMAKDPDATLIFYGGEPLLNVEKMYELMDVVPAKRFMLHTNGTMLHRVRPEYLNRLHTISISIDGDEALTDYNRGKGVYRRIASNARLVRENGFKGEMIARMTVTEDCDIYRQALFLLNSQDFSFDSVHWQLNALFWKNDYGRRQFSRWARDSYNPGITRLAGEWVRVMREEGRVLRMYPFMSIMRSLLLEEKTLLRCGAGWAEFNVQTDGMISPCPVMSGMKKYYAGDIFKGDPLRLKQTLISGPCEGCEMLDICGGRCLYANVTMKWGDKGFAEVCSTVKHLINTLKDALPEIRQLLKEGKISMEDFDHIKFNSCEIIP